MLYKRKCYIILLLVFSLPCVSEVFADDITQCELIAYPRDWKIPEPKISGKILLAWQVSNIGEKAIRFRIRDLGKISLVDSNGLVINPSMLGVDATKEFQERDYPSIGPGETLYFPFVVSFRRQKNNLFSLKIRSDSDGDDGWIFTDLKEGKYLIIGKYSSLKNSTHDGGFIWGQELKFLKPRFLDDFWEGEIVSKKIEIAISN